MQVRVLPGSFFLQGSPLSEVMPSRNILHLLQGLPRSVLPGISGVNCLAVHLLDQASFIGHKALPKKKKSAWNICNSISGLVAEYIVAIDVTRVRFPADASFTCRIACGIAAGDEMAQQSYPQASTLRLHRQRAGQTPCITSGRHLVVPPQASNGPSRPDRLAF